MEERSKMRKLTKTEGREEESGDSKKIVSHRMGFSTVDVSWATQVWGSAH